ncbi:MAG: ParA family protein [Actinomycetia bacterium]|nr:ParA family protein [Actinomycetes bacterium]MCP5033419.1 ParA family protein [Actinomycetes bacterium]
MVIATGKGGCGKTTLTANLATLAAARGVDRVIAVDLDPQANLATALGIKDHDGGLSMLSAAMREDRAAPKLHDTGRDNLWYVAGGSQLKRLRSVAMFKGGPYTLAGWILDSLEPLADGRTILFIDTPQASGDILASAGLLAGESLLIPTRLDGFSLAGVSTVVEELLDLHDGGGGEWAMTNILGVVLFAVNRRASAIERRTREILQHELAASRVRLLDASVMATDKAQIDAIMAGISAAEYALIAKTTALPPWYETLGTTPDDRLSFANNADSLAADYEAIAVEVDKALAEDLG